MCNAIAWKAVLQPIQKPFENKLGFSEVKLRTRWSRGGPFYSFRVVQVSRHTPNFRLTPKPPSDSVSHLNVFNAMHTHCVAQVNIATRYRFRAD